MELMVILQGQPGPPGPLESFFHATSRHLSDFTHSAGWRLGVKKHPVRRIIELRSSQA